MIPSFPTFKKIEVTDRDLLARFLPREPYSDYNFTNLWCWNIDHMRKVSELNGNLVILFTDYVDKKLFLSFCGKRKPVSTARTLIHYAKKQGIEPVLKYVPDSTARVLEKSKGVRLSADHENFDYIFSTTHIAQAEGSRFKKKRQLANKFIKAYPDAVFIVEKNLSQSVQNHILGTMTQWRKKKNNLSQEQFEQEKKALMRLLKSNKQHPVVVSAIYRNKKMLAFSIDEVLTNRYAISHFLKADKEYVGVYEYLNQKTAAYLKELGIEYWNWEQDLNIEGLRNLKMSYRPIRFLKKHKIMLSTNKTTT